MNNDLINSFEHLQQLLSKPIVLPAPLPTIKPAIVLDPEKQKFKEKKQRQKNKMEQPIPASNHPKYIKSSVPIEELGRIISSNVNSPIVIGEPKANQPNENKPVEK